MQPVHCMVCNHALNKPAFCCISSLMKGSSGLQLRAERRIFGKMFRKTFQVISEASAAGWLQPRCPPGVAWRTFRSQGRFSSGSCSRCWRPQTVEGRRNTFKSVLPKLGSSVLSLSEHEGSKEARLSVALWWKRRAQARCVPALFFHLVSCWLCTSLGWRWLQTSWLFRLQEILFPALDEFTFPISICFNCRAVRTLSYPLFPSLPPPPLIKIIVWTSVEFRCKTFAALRRIKHAVSWPFVCSDFYSAGKRRSLETPQKMLCSLKNTSFRCRLLGLTSWLFFCSILGQHC